MSRYNGMLPQVQKEGYRGYYPVTSKEEWEELPEVYKVMEWRAVKDPFDKEKRLRAVKAVIFDVVYMEPYKISAEVSVHPQEVQKILFCSFKNSQCLLYTVKAVILEGGSRVGAKWYQDSTTGSFGIYALDQYVGVQGGFDCYIPKSCDLQEDGSYKYNFHKPDTGVIAHYELSNPFGR